MCSKFVVNFRVSKDQLLDKGCVVTYLNESRLVFIKENLSIQSDFFVVSDINLENITITNGIDKIESTEEQLIKVVPFLEEIIDLKKPLPGDADPSRYLRDLIKWNDAEELRKSYRIGDNYLSIISSGLIITEKDFYLENSNVLDINGKKKIIASLIPEKISMYLEDK